MAGQSRSVCHATETAITIGVEGGDMKKATLLVGFGAGYVLGSRAGRERYEQIRRWWRGLIGSAPVQQAAGRGRELAGEAGRKAVHGVQRGLDRVGTSVKSRLGNGHADDITREQVGP
jgi:hypothetical protein